MLPENSPASVNTLPIEFVSVLAPRSMLSDLMECPSGIESSTRWLAPSGHDPMVSCWFCPTGVTAFGTDLVADSKGAGCVGGTSDNRNKTTNPDARAAARVWLIWW